MLPRISCVPLWLLPEFLRLFLSVIFFACPLCCVTFVVCFHVCGHFVDRSFSLCSHLSRVVIMRNSSLCSVCLWLFLCHLTGHLTALCVSLRLHCCFVVILHLLVVIVRLSAIVFAHLHNFFASLWEVRVLRQCVVIFHTIHYS